MQTENAPSAKRGKKPKLPDHLKVYKTAVFKIHNPSKHKRAMLAEHLAVEALVVASQGRSADALPIIAQIHELSDHGETVVAAALANAVIASEANSKAPEIELAAADAFNRGFLDCVTVASRAFPQLASGVASIPHLRSKLADLFVASCDIDLGRSAGLTMPRELRRSSGLSRREREVYDLLILGRTNREIAKTLYISESTAKVHVRHILEKLGVHSRAEAAASRADVL